MRVISINLNGIRAAKRKGYLEWMLAQQADFICMQETKAQMQLLDDADFWPQGYYHCFVDAQKKGYSGVGIYAKTKPNKIITKLGFDVADNEGRYVQFDYPGLSVVSIYLPSGSSGDERQAIKFQFMDFYKKLLQKQIKQKREYIICGDWNIVHKEIDIKNFKSNQKNSGCLPEERAWIDDIFNKVGFVDAFREANGEPHQYTWWSNRGQAWANNVGWRIDYQVVSPGLKAQIKSACIYKDERFSDHSPLIIDYKR